ncbi:MAG TPA: sodium:solute symporter, partial [Chitinophagales bacterium]|nr:sodium:solute symporter [Chitinophagales bacterium]
MLQPMQFHYFAGNKIPLQPNLSPYQIFLFLGGYFLVLLFISRVTGKGAGSAEFFIGQKKSPWYAVAFGMIGDSLSGVTFISVPGAVGASQFSYLQLVFGYFFGYLVISEILLPLYYRLNLTSIYSYLNQRFGEWSEKTGSFFFLLSRTMGAAARLYLTAGVVQLFMFDRFGIPFWLSVTMIIVLILVYTYRGGIKTLVWTDTFQSLALLTGVLLSIAFIAHQLGLSVTDLIVTVKNSELSKTFFWDWQAKSFFPKQFLGGMFIAITMTGLDQNMMQKNLSCRTLEDAQKNIRWFSIVVVLVNVFFLSLGVLLYTYSSSKGISIPVNENGKPITDHLFPMLALQHLGTLAGLFFIVGLTAATFSSADSVLTTLTTSFYIDFLHADTNAKIAERKKTQLRHIIMISFAAILLIVILLFKLLNNQAIIDTVLKVAGYTYGPLLGLYAF